MLPWLNAKYIQLEYTLYLMYCVNVHDIFSLLALKMYFTLFFEFVDIAFQTKYYLHGCN